MDDRIAKRMAAIMGGGGEGGSPGHRSSQLKLYAAVDPNAAAAAASAPAVIIPPSPVANTSTSLTSTPGALVPRRTAPKLSQFRPQTKSSV